MGTFKTTGNLPILAQTMLTALQQIGDDWNSQVVPNFNNMETEWAGLAYDAAGVTFGQMNSVMQNQLQELQNFCTNVIKFHGDTSELDSMGQRMLQQQ